MKHLFIYFFISVCLIAFVDGQTLEEKERELYKEHGVKSRTNTDYSFTKGKFSVDGRKTSFSVYDENGFVLKSFSFNPKGDTTSYEKYAYDKNGNRTIYERQSLSGEYKKESEYNTISKLIEEYGYDGSAKFRTVLTYDDKNRVTEIVYYIVDRVDEKRVYTYNGNKASVEILKQGLHLTSSIDLVFNDAQQVISEDYKSIEGKLLESKKYEYSSKGDLIKEEKYKDGNMFYRITYDYDINRNLLAVSEESMSKEKFIKKKYTYDNKNRITEYQWKRNPDDEYNIKVFKYGEKGVCEEEHTFYPKTEYRLLTKYTYEYY
ncbi:MAG: hypothetical protein JXP36_13670 [Bacteroidales bacterium]|nr:hypothetical protein [Bacteroidales bacterium]